MPKDDHSSVDSDSGSDPRWHERAAGRFTTTSTMGYYIAVGVLLLAVLGLAAVFIHPNKTRSSTAVVTQVVTAGASSGAGGAAAVGPSHANDPSGSPSEPVSASGCTVSQEWDATPVQAAPKVTWQPVAALVAPVSAQLGPQKVSGPDGAVRECYAHSPAGAVLAAVNIVVGSSDIAAGNLVVDKQFTEGAGKQEALAQQGVAGSFTIAGFQVQGCTATKCVISVAATGNGQTVASATPLVWSQGDWKVDGSVVGISEGSGALSSLAGYVPFSPGDVS